MEDGSKKKKKTEDELPPEIIHAILSRVPTEPLCRFKLVSKSWQSLISDPNFLANYSKSAVVIKDVLLSRRRLFFTILSGSTSQVYSLNLDHFLIENDHNVDDMVTLEAVPTEVDIVCHFVPEKGWLVRGSCSGLFLSQSNCDDSSYSLINPVTKETKTLPKPPIWRLPREPYEFCIYGFGFDYSTNDYKVINGQQYADGVVFSVYTLQTGSWRQIEYLFPYIVLDLDGIMVSGGVHWFIWLVKKVEDGSLAIISFHLAEEEVREIALPPNANGHSRLGAFRNWLCVTSISVVPSVTFDEFWVMKKYGASESWTEMRVSIPYTELSHSGFWTETHDLMVFDRSSLVMYNFDDDKFWTSSVGKTGVISSFGVYVETLHTLTHQSRASSSKEGDSDII